MIAMNRQPLLGERDYASVFQGMLPEVEARVGKALAAEVAAERTEMLIYGHREFCVWDGDWPLIIDGHVARTTAYTRFLEEASMTARERREANERETREVPHTVEAVA